MDDGMDYGAYWHADELIAAIPEFVEKHFPKNDTAAEGGERTPGRGEAAVLLTQFIMELQR